MRYPQRYAKTEALMVKAPIFQGAIKLRNVLDCQAKILEAVMDGRISDLLKFLVPKVGESFVLDHNVESQEVAQARPRPELAGALETILELAAL